MGKVKSLFFSFSGALFGVVTLLLNKLAHGHSALVETWYSRGLFIRVRHFWEVLLSYSSVPGFYFFWTGVVAYWIWVWWRRPKKVQSRLSTVKYWLGRILGFSGFLAGSFFWLWGFNYARVPIQEQLQFSPEPLDSVRLWTALERETQALTKLRAQLVGSDTTPLSDKRFWPLSAEDTVRAAVQNWLGTQGFPAASKVRGRLIAPKGLLFSFGASGIYWPWAGEGNLESGMHPLRILPAMAHEMSHAYGFGDEGVCNFIAYVSLSDHPNVYLAYTSRLDYWGDLARACRRQNPETYHKMFLPGIPQGVLADEEDIRRQHAQYQELAPAIRYQVYDSYLKSQGIASGMLNYNEVIMLVEAWIRQDY